MKVTYDPHTDSLSIVLRDDGTVAESDEERPGIVLDFDAEGNLVSLEILDASRRVTDTGKVDYKVTA